ncbi:cytochrome c-type biogenesis protein [Mannheimia massilioguelmaensis]|uniref:cytochrome c-type biogenesis protein n=1 Tax=Mannheimia massilioguelmaensis TaxID=1604354 RepID=UPI0005C9552C|nr:cytochrome c-type biogenesis protein [Mannheimia massilioguelmaensis]
MKKLTALLVMISAVSLPSFAAIDAFNFSSEKQESDYHTLTQELRCPQCQNNNIADSNAVIAIDMREKVFELLQEGKSKQDIVQYMVDRYGNFVTYNPPITAATILLWILPVLLVLLGLGFLFRKKSKSVSIKVSESTNLSSQTLSIEEQKRLDTLLKDKE